jgi:hypothetical protein
MSDWAGCIIDMSALRKANTEFEKPHPKTTLYLRG